jgi:hypothetical protein
MELGLHPDLVSVAKDIFDQFMPEKNQIDKKFDYQITENDLLEIPKEKLPNRVSEKISTSEFCISNLG